MKTLRVGRCWGLCLISRQASAAVCAPFSLMQYCILVLSTYRDKTVAHTSFFGRAVPNKNKTSAKTGPSLWRARLKKCLPSVNAQLRMIMFIYLRLETLWCVFAVPSLKLEWISLCLELLYSSISEFDDRHLSTRQKVSTPAMIAWTVFVIS